MKEIRLTKGRVALIDDTDFGAVDQFKWGASKSGKLFYAVHHWRKSDGSKTKIYLHRFLMPGVKSIDHKDGDGLNCQRYNLRPASKRQNQQAFRRKAEGKTSQFRGVSWHKKNQKWTTKIETAGKQIYLGCFLFERDAAHAYDEAARKFFGEFAAPNFPI